MAKNNRSKKSVKRTSRLATVTTRQVGVQRPRLVLPKASDTVALVATGVALIHPVVGFLIAGAAFGLGYWERLRP